MNTAVPRARLLEVYSVFLLHIIGSLARTRVSLIDAADRSLAVADSRPKASCSTHVRAGDGGRNEIDPVGDSVPSRLDETPYGWLLD